MCENRIEWKHTITTQKENTNARRDLHCDHDGVPSGTGCQLSGCLQNDSEIRW